MGQDVRRGARRLRNTAPQHPVVVIHSLAHAVAALEAAAELGRPIVLLSAPDAGTYAGAGWFKAVAEAAREAVPAAQFSAILDCGDRAGAVQAAVRAGIGAVVFTGSADARERLAAIATAAGSRLLTSRPEPVLDLGRWFFADGETLHGHCRAALAAQPPDAARDFMC